MKKVLMMFAFLAFAVAMNAQNPQSAQAPAPAKKANVSKYKDHVCNADCKPDNHALLHGEKGHSCGDACKKMSHAKKAEHTCAAECKDGKHAYAHGEKGHSCGAACKNMKHDKKP